MITVILFLVDADDGKSAVSAGYERGCTLAATLDVGQVEGLLLDETACYEAVARLQLAVLRLLYFIGAFAQIAELQQTVGTPTDRNKSTFL